MTVLLPSCEGWLGELLRYCYPAKLCWLRRLLVEIAEVGEAITSEGEIDVADVGQEFMRIVVQGGTCFVIVM